MTNVPKSHESEPDTWAHEMVRDLPPLTRDQVLTISVYRRVFPGMPWSLKRDPAA